MRWNHASFRVRLEGRFLHHRDVFMMVGHHLQGLLAATVDDSLSTAKVLTPIGVALVLSVLPVLITWHLFSVIPAITADSFGRTVLVYTGIGV